MQALPGLLRLPRELRDQIYEHLYANAIGTEPMIVSLQRRDSTIYCFDIRQFWLVRNMFSVSRLLRDESIEHIIGAGKNVKRNIGIELPFPNRWQLNRLPAWLQTRILVIEDSRPFISARTLDGPASCLPNLEKIAVSQRRSVQHGRETITDAADLRRLLRGSHDNWISASGDSYDYLLGNPPKMNLEGGQIEVTIISYTDIRTTDYTIPSRDPVSRVYVSAGFMLCIREQANGNSRSSNSMLMIEEQYSAMSILRVTILREVQEDSLLDLATSKIWCWKARWMSCPVVSIDQCFTTSRAADLG